MGDTLRIPRRDVAPEIADSRARRRPTFGRRVWVRENLRDFWTGFGTCRYGAESRCLRASMARAGSGARRRIIREEGGGGLAFFAQGITPFALSMASREARSRPCGPAAPIDSLRCGVRRPARAIPPGSTPSGVQP
jgi:hypothetical protein